MKYYMTKCLFTANQLSHNRHLYLTNILRVSPTYYSEFFRENEIYEVCTESVSSKEANEK